MDRLGFSVFDVWSVLSVQRLQCYRENIEYVLTFVCPLVSALLFTLHGHGAFEVQDCTVVLFCAVPGCTAPI